MKNKIDLVNDAFSMLLRTGVTVQATNADIELALGRLEDVMAELESRNLATGYNFENPPQPDSPSGLEDYMNLAVSRLLAVNVWPDFSPEAVNQMLLMQSAQSQSNLSARLAQQSMLKYAKRMPLGSGNQPYQQYQKFYGDYSADCGTSCAIPAAAPVPPPFDSDAIVVDNLKLLASESTSEATGKAFFVNSFYAGWSTPSGGGWFVWSASESKANHNGVTVYAPEALEAWSGAQSDIATLLNWSGLGMGCWLRNDLQGFVTPEMAGAVGDSSTNDTSSVSKSISVASSSLEPVMSYGKIYGVSGNIALPSWVWINGLKLKQLTPNSTSRRTLFQANGQFCRLENVIVDRNGDGSGGSLTDAAGVWVNDCPSVLMNNVEVFGNDFGNGIAVIRCDNARINNIYVHDITGGTASSPAVTDDTIHGLWIQGGTGVSVDNPRVKNLLNRWNGQPAFNRFSRGIAVGGAKQFSISAPIVDNVDQGLDITGDQNPEFFEINGGIVSNCYTWGMKCANSVQNGVFTGVIAYRCGNSGFVASAPSVVMPDITQNITYTGCKSIQTGFGGVWTASSNVAGFRVASTVQYPDYPRSIKYVGCSADGVGGVMEYGFFSDATLTSSNGETWIEAIHCDVQGATVKNYFGIQTGYARKRRSGTPQSIPNDVWTDLDYTETIDYMGASIGASAATLLASRSGIYMVSAGVTFNGNINGNRGVRILVDGSVVPGSTLRIAVGDANERNITTTVPVAIATAGAQIKVQVLQSSGGALDVVGPTAFNLALISAGFGG